MLRQDDEHRTYRFPNHGFYCHQQGKDWPFSNTCNKLMLHLLRLSIEVQQALILN